MSRTGARPRRKCATCRSTIIWPISTWRSTRSARRSIWSACARAGGCRWSMPRVFPARCGGSCWPARRSISPRRQNSRRWWPHFRALLSSRWCSRATVSSAASTCSGSGTLRSAGRTWKPRCNGISATDRTRRADLLDRFARWDRATLDLPGTYYLEVTERVFRQNQIAEGRFVALGRRIDLAEVRVPVFLLAGADDIVVPRDQAFATAALLGTRPAWLERASEPCGHLGLFMGRKTLGDSWRRDRPMASGRHRRCRRGAKSARENAPDCGCNPGRNAFRCGGLTSPRPP